MRKFSLMTLCNELHSINDTAITSQVALVFAPHRRQSAHDVKICGKIRFFLLHIIFHCKHLAQTDPDHPSTCHTISLGVKIDILARRCNLCHSPASFLFSLQVTSLHPTLGNSPRSHVAPTLSSLFHLIEFTTL